MMTACLKDVLVDATAHQHWVSAGKGGGYSEAAALNRPREGEDELP